MAPQRPERISSTMAINYARACTLIAISSRWPSTLNRWSANRLPNERFLCVLTSWRALTLNNQPIVDGKEGVNSPPKRSMLYAWVYATSLG